MNDKEIIKEAEELLFKHHWSREDVFYEDTKEMLLKFRESGIQSERQRTKALVEALEKIRNIEISGSNFNVQWIISQALTLYNQSKETVTK